MQLGSYTHSIATVGDLLAKQLKLSLPSVDATATALTLHAHHQDIYTVQTVP